MRTFLKALSILCLHLSVLSFLDFFVLSSKFSSLNMRKCFELFVYFHVEHPKECHQGCFAMWHVVGLDG